LFYAKISLTHLSGDFLMQSRFFLLLLLLLAITPSLQAQDTLVVFAASSLSDAFTEVATAFQAEHPDVEILFNFGSSATLATQLSEGAPADVFASANNSQMNAARDAGRITGSPQTFVKNRLVLIVPIDNPANIQSLQDLDNEGVQLVVAAEGVPVRDYTNTMLERLAADPLYGEAYRGAVVANIVSEEDNVRQVAAKVALGEADAGIVYVSDVTPDIAEQVIAISIPDSLNTIATYPIAVTNNSAHPELAQAFVDFVLSDAGQDILVSWNFISIRIPEVPNTVTLPTDGTLTVDGQVLNPLSLTVETLQTQFGAQTIEASYLNGEETVSASYTGVSLWQVVSAAQPNLNADIPNDQLGFSIVVTGSDAYQAVFSWGELDPAYGGELVLLAYAENAAPITDAQGAVRLIVPSDQSGGRYVRGVVNISLRDAPGS
jgi:molybdate transport system substrate-binding protein